MIKSRIKQTLGGVLSRVTQFCVRNWPNRTAAFLVNSRIYYKMRVWGGFSLSKMVAECFQNFLTEVERGDDELKSYLTKDIVKSYLLYGVNPEEYFLHGFRNLSDVQRKTYLPKALKDQLVIKQIGEKSDKAFVELKDKYEFYKLAKPYFKRDACSLKSRNDYSAFKMFVEKHNRFIAKPIKGRYGSNTSIYNIADFNGGAEFIFEHLMGITDEWIIEELIEQDARMAEWNPSSVNTIRVPSFRTKSGIQILAPFIRMGRKGSVVDNAGSGGIYATLDAETGKICSVAMDERGNVYETNPDNGKIFKDWQCPKWSELISISKEVHKSLPEYHKYVGFDFALSTKGWVLVEGNWGDFICQQSSLGRGMKEEFVSLLNS